MKFKLKSDKDNNEVVEFWLEITGNNVILKAQKKGEDIIWRILTITPEGFLLKFDELSFDLGLKLDNHGKILEV